MKHVTMFLPYSSLQKPSESSSSTLDSTSNYDVSILCVANGNRVILLRALVVNTLPHTLLSSHLCPVTQLIEVDFLTTDTDGFLVRSDVVHVVVMWILVL